MERDGFARPEMASWHSSNVAVTAASALCRLHPKEPLTVAPSWHGLGCTAVPRFRLEFNDNGSEIDLEADDFDDDGEWVSLYRYRPEGADPTAPETTKEVVAAFERASLVGPPRPVG